MTSDITGPGDVWSEARIEWCAAFVTAWAAFPTIEKNRKATIPGKDGRPGFEYTYADLTRVVEAVKPVLTANGFAAVQSVTGIDRGIAVTTRIIHKAGWVEEFGPTVVPFNGDARTAGGAITYARRYALTAALGITTDDDVDAPPVADHVDDWHDKAWAATWVKCGKDEKLAGRVFAEALIDVGIVDDARIETEVQHDAVILRVDDKIEPDDSPGSGG